MKLLNGKEMGQRQTWNWKIKIHQQNFRSSVSAIRWKEERIKDPQLTQRNEEGIFDTFSFNFFCKDSVTKSMQKSSNERLEPLKKHKLYNEQKLKGAKIFLEQSKTTKEKKPLKTLILRKSKNAKKR